LAKRIQSFGLGSGAGSFQCGRAALLGRRRTGVMAEPHSAPQVNGIVAQPLKRLSITGKTSCGEARCMKY